MVSAFGNAIGFLNTLGLYDVILPFLLTFTIIYAIMDKTRVLGYDDFEGKKYPKKNLNALVAFCIGFLVIASSNLVGLMHQALAQLVIVFMICVFYIALVGIFYKDNVEDQFSKGWKLFFMITLLIAIILIFANAIKIGDGTQSVLEFIYNQLAFNIDSAAVSTVVLILLIAGTMYYIVSSKPSGGGEKKDGGDKK